MFWITAPDSSYGGLASGENPEWIAQQMGHSATELLFRSYSRYVPNLTRQDGAAFESLLNRTLDK